MSIIIDRDAARAARAARARLGDADALVARLLDLGVARRLALDAFLRLSAVAWDDDVASACVECVASPRLLLNPDFVEAHCASARRLAFLLMHELAHVSLGHTGLHPRVTPAQNIAFDAVINATLLQGILHDGHSIDGWDDLVVAIYAASRSPEFLLRPPPGWPEAPDWAASAGAPDDLRGVHRRLYDCRPSTRVWSEKWCAPQLDSVTYGEIVRALTHVGEGADEGVNGAGGAEGADGGDGAGPANGGELAGLLARLLGAHGVTPRECSATSCGRDALASEVLADVLAALPSGRSDERGMGGGVFAVRLDGRRDERLVAALRTLVRRSLMARGGKRELEEVYSPMWGVDPTRDRRAHVRRHAARLLGAPAPLFFVGESVRQRPSPQGAAAIYLDASGSMGDWVGRLHAALVPLRRFLAPRLFVFSTVVEEYSRADFVRGRVATTGGTDIVPVLQHLAAESRAGRVRRALLLTDGLVGEPSRVVLRDFVASGAELHVGLIAGSTMPKQRWSASVTLLPAAGGER